MPGLASLVVATLALAGTTTPALRVVTIPEARDTFQKDGAAFRAWLGREAGVPVEVQVAETYEDAVRLLVTREADFGWLGGVTTVQAMTLSGGRIRPVLIRENDREFKSYVVASGSLSASSLDALRGKRFTFGSESSTSGHVMPRFYLQREGLVPEKFFESVSYSGDHRKTVLAVASGQKDCGAVNYKIFDQMVAEKAVDPAKVKIVWTSPTFTDNAWVAARDVDDRLGAGLLEKITGAFLRLDAGRPEDRRVLDILRTTRYVAARPEWWRDVAAALQVISPGLKP